MKPKAFLLSSTNIYLEIFGIHSNRIYHRPVTSRNLGSSSKTYIFIKSLITHPFNHKAKDSESPPSSIPSDYGR